jgi:hypothetical protein
MRFDTRGIKSLRKINFFEFLYLVYIKKSLIYNNRIIISDIEKSLLEFIDYVNEQYLSVAIVGGGDGITGMYFSRFYNPLKICIFEASDLQIDLIRRNMNINQINDIEIIHGIVGENIFVYKFNKMGQPISLLQLSDFDYIEIDIEGSEYNLLKNLTIFPRFLSIEFHPVKVNYLEDLNLLSMSYKLIQLRDESHTIMQPTINELINHLRNSKIVHGLFTLK